MIYFLYGLDTYRSRKKLRAIVNEYQKKWGSNLNVEKFDAEENDVGQMIALAGHQSLFAGKKLAVIERFFSAASGPLSKKSFGAEFEKLKSKLPALQTSQDIIVFFWDAEINADAKKEIKNFLRFVAKSEEFPVLSGESLRRAVATEARERGVALSATDAAALMNRFGGDLWGIANELDKAAVAGTVDVASRLPTEDKLYKFTDAVIDGKSEAPFLLRALYEAGINELYVLGALRNSIRGLLLVSDAIYTKQSLGPVEKFLQAHPFVFKKMQQQARTRSFAELENLYRDILSVEQEMKGGGTAGRGALEYFVEQHIRVSR